MLVWFDKNMVSAQVGPAWYMAYIANTFDAPKILIVGVFSMEGY